MYKSHLFDISSFNLVYLEHPIPEAHGPHCSHEKHFLAINMLEQSYNHSSRLVKSFYYLPLEKGMALHLIKFELPSLKDALSQVWIKLGC